MQPFSLTHLAEGLVYRTANESLQLFKNNHVYKKNATSKHSMYAYCLICHTYTAVVQPFVSVLGDSNCISLVSNFPTFRLAASN